MKRQVNNINIAKKQNKVSGVIGGSVKVGHSPIFVAEACEYNRSFLHLSPTVAVVLNIDEDHLDCYKDIEENKTEVNKKTLADLVNKNGEKIFSCSGYADTRRIKENDTEDNKRSNRRIDLRFNIATPTNEELEIIRDINKDYTKNRESDK